jgi:LysM repeat protein
MQFSWALLAIASVTMTGMVGCSNTSTSPSSKTGYWPDHKAQHDPADQLLADIRNNSRDDAAGLNAGASATALDPVIIDAVPVAPAPSPAPIAVAQPPAAPAPVVVYQPSPAPTPVVIQSRPPTSLVVKASADTTYVVKKGDSLWVISRRFYGKGSKWKTIANANPNINPNKLKLGQKLKIPSGATVSSKAALPGAGSNQAAAVDTDAQFK